MDTEQGEPRTVPPTTDSEGAAGTSVGRATSPTFDGLHSCVPTAVGGTNSFNDLGGVDEESDDNEGRS